MKHKAIISVWYCSGVMAMGSLLAMLPLEVVAQDAQFSQQGIIPTHIDPSLAAAGSDRRLVLVHRDQRVPGGEPFRTTGLAFDACLNPINKERRSQNGRIGAGLSVVNDRSGTPAFRTTDVQANLAYQLFIDGYSSIGAGIQAGSRLLSADPQAGSWASQYDGMRYDAALPHGEPIGTNAIARPDVGLGMNYQFRRMPDPRRHSNTLELRAGAAVFHAARPDLSLFDRHSDRLYRRWSTWVQGEIGLGGGRITLLPSAWHHMQGASRQLLAGLSVRRALGERGFMGPDRESAVTLGLYMRNTNALVTTVEMAWGDYALCLAYDMPMAGDLSTPSPMHAMELALRYMLPAVAGGRR